MNNALMTEQDEDFTLDDLFSEGQIRLAEVSMCNWGTFSGIHTAQIDKIGTLVTGDNGAGKSTFIDALNVLLQPAGRAIFNTAAAQGSKSDRNLMSYMRGQFGSEHIGADTKKKYKRDGAVLTGVRALYEADSGVKFTLAALFWINKSTNEAKDVSRLYIVASENLKLEDLIENFKDGSPKQLKHWLSEKQGIICVTDNFSQHMEAYKNTLRMENDNAPKLLGRALGLKKIDDLTAIIRDLVLEPSTVRENVQEIVEEFGNLVATHDQLLDTRKQKDHLMPLFKLDDDLASIMKVVKRYQAQKDSLSTYIYKQSLDLCETKKSAIEKESGIIKNKIAETQQRDSDAKDSVEDRHNDYMNAGGDRVELIDSKLKSAEANLNKTLSEASKYQEKARLLSLPDEIDKDVFDSNREAAKQSYVNASSVADESVMEVGRISNLAISLKDEEATIQNEIKAIQSRPNSNIDHKHQRKRDEMVSALGLMPEECMFVGELLEVKEAEYEWHGAIERALSGRSKTLLVPDHARGAVAEWMNSHYLGVTLHAEPVDLSQVRPANFKDDGFLRKLNWRNHDYRDWLKSYLAGNDLHCVASASELNKTPHSMTKEGLIKSGTRGLSKKDSHELNDRRVWSLGFSNHSRLALKQKELLDIGERILSITSEQEDAVAKMRVQKQIENLWRDLLAFEWDGINSPYWLKSVETLKKEKAAIEDAQGDMAKAKALWDEAKIKAFEIGKELSQLQVLFGSTNSRLEAVKSQLERIKLSAAGDLDPEVAEALSNIVTPLVESDLDNLSQIIVQYSAHIEANLSSAREARTKIEHQATSIMSRFRGSEKWGVNAVEWDDSIDSIPEYLSYLQDIIDNGLPELEERFKSRLNKHATQSLAKFKQSLQSERDDIIDRVEMITNVLGGTEFRSGTVLRLEARVLPYARLDDLMRKITKALSMIASDDHEARYQQLLEIMEILAKASDGATYNTLESLKLLDPRYQMDFYAEERDKETGEILDVWLSSTGKSGGEKESFAGAIVAASLAYVLTPEGYHQPVYSTVFLDEAFSNTSEVVSRRILKIFKDLKIHVNLITPYKNMNLARESAATLLLVDKDAKANESSFAEISWEEADKILSNNKEYKLAQEASELEVEVEQVDD